MRPGHDDEHLKTQEGEMLVRNWLTWLSMGLFLILAVAGCSTSSSTPSAPGTSGGQDTEANNEGSQQPTEVFELEFGLWTPATHHLHLETATPWKEMVEEKTGGRIIVNLYPGATLGGSRAVWEDVSGGVYDLGLLCNVYYPESPFLIPAVNDLPFAYGNAPSGEANVAYQKFLDLYIDSDFEEKVGVKILYMFPSDPYMLFSTKAAGTADALRGLKIRVPGPGWDAVYQEWGAVPVSMAPEDAYTALERGTLDIMVYSFVGGYGFKYHEVAPYMLDFPAFRTSCSFAMNPDFYRQLPSDLQQLMDEELGPALGQFAVNAYTNKTAEVREAIANEGGEFIPFSEADQQTLSTGSKVAWTNYIQRANEQGFDGEKIVRDFLEIVRAEGLQPPFTEADLGISP